MKQAILVRQDLKMPKGKMSAQVAHASLEAAYKSNQNIVEKWRSTGAKKVILKVENKKQLLDFIRKAKRNNLTISLIRDAGHTFLLPGTMTCGAIGPDTNEKIDSITSSLNLI